MVSIPHRQDKNDRNGEKLFNQIYVFPFLIGRIRTNIFGNRLDARIGVSIPHRQDKNLPYNEFRSNFVKFPFLIGRIRTKNPIKKQLKLFYVSIPHRQDKNASKEFDRIDTIIAFPFLIGRIRTKMNDCQYLGKNQFPFLIGRIRTKHIYHQACISISVSIPHRQDKNKQLKFY